MQIFNKSHTETIRNILEYFEREKKEGPKYSIFQVDERTAAATGVSRSLIVKVAKSYQIETVLPLHYLWPLDVF